ncbi:uncharacterized protein LOC136074288 [Hydra vulgaris]|uniref:Uncharacterized protein LOC136074288 n=1 Tax=Hydra vulgaris TaxID=6087 RepID=A0ABM4B1I9_HYDVU
MATETEIINISEILNIREKPMVEYGIEECEYFEYQPASLSNYNSETPISINTTLESVYMLPSEAYLWIEGRLLKTDDLSGEEIESLNNPGRATTMLGFAARQSWIIQKPNSKGSFSACIPLKHIFGFCNDYDKVVYGFTHTITLDRKSDNEAIFRAAGVAAGKVDIQKLSLFMPHVRPLPKMRVPVAFRSRGFDSLPVPVGTTEFSWQLSSRINSTKPRYVIIGFQTNKLENQEINYTLFNHCDVKDMSINVNSRKYPTNSYNLSFPNNQFSRIYKAAAEFSKKFYGMSELITNCDISPSEFKDLYPLFVFDISKQIQDIKGSTLNLTVKVTFNSSVPADTMAYSVVISDTLFNFESDDKNKIMENVIDVNEKRHVGRPRIHPIKEVTEKKSVGRPRLDKVKEPEKKEIDPKYERLRIIRKEPVTVKLTNIDTGEEIIYKSLYKAMKETKHGFGYFELRDDKSDNRPYKSEESVSPASRGLKRPASEPLEKCVPQT